MYVQEIICTCYEWLKKSHAVTIVVQIQLAPVHAEVLSTCKSPYYSNNCENQESKYIREFLFPAIDA